MLSIERKSLESLAALALFTFAFLGSEFFFDRRMGTLLPAEGVVGAQALILGASVVGFLAFAALSKLPRAQAWAPFAEAAGAIACLIAVLMLDDVTALQIADAQASYFWGARERKPTGTWLAHSKEAPHSPKALVPPMQQAFCCNSRTTNSFPRAHGKSPCSAQEPRR